MDNAAANIQVPLARSIKIKWDVPASSQESAFQNATLTTLTNGDAISVAIHPPADLDLTDKSSVEDLLEHMFERFASAGWAMEIQAGPDDDAAQFN